MQQGRIYDLGIRASINVQAMVSVTIGTYVCLMEPGSWAG
jgi:hypothetical protein